MSEKDNGTIRPIAFTLVEVLIVIGIIGIVAAMTIPNLLNKTNDAELKTALKKQSGTVSQVLLRILDNNGGTFHGLCPGTSGNSSCLVTLFAPYLNVSKQCSNSASEGCWHKANQWFFLMYDACSAGNNYAGYLTNCPGTTNSWPGLILNDGTLMTFENQDGNCQFTYGSSSPLCADIMIDVNGFKKPNTIGRDIFAFWIAKDKIIPVGSGADAQNCSGFGWGCTAEYLNN